MTLADRLASAAKSAPVFSTTLETAPPHTRINVQGAMEVYGHVPQDTVIIAALEGYASASVIVEESVGLRAAITADDVTVLGATHDQATICATHDITLSRAGDHVQLLAGGNVTLDTIGEGGQIVAGGDITIAALGTPSGHVKTLFLSAGGEVRVGDSATGQQVLTPEDTSPTPGVEVQWMPFYQRILAHRLATPQASGEEPSRGR